MCNLKANSVACFIHISNVKQSDAYFHNFTLNPVKILGQYRQSMTVFLVSGQRLLFAKMVLRILLEISFQPLVTYYMILKTDKVVGSSHNYLWSSPNIHLVDTKDVLANDTFLSSVSTLFVAACVLFEAPPFQCLCKRRRRTSYTIDACAQFEYQPS